MQNTRHKARQRDIPNEFEEYLAALLHSGYLGKGNAISAVKLFQIPIPILGFTVTVD
jgi:hypothetical protein